MQTEKVQVLFSLAEQMLEAAENETMRSQEDAVTHLICHNARQSTINYLQGFLLKNNVEPTDPPTMHGLLEQCKDIDARFELADISPVQCRFEPNATHYCLDNDTVEGCFKTAQKVRNIVMTEVPGF